MSGRIWGVLKSFLCFCCFAQAWGCVKSLLAKFFSIRWLYFLAKAQRLKKTQKQQEVPPHACKYCKFGGFAQLRSAQIRSIRVISVPLKLSLKREIYRTPRLFTQPHVSRVRARARSLGKRTTQTVLFLSRQSADICNMVLIFNYSDVTRGRAAFLTAEFFVHKFYNPQPTTHNLQPTTYKCITSS